MNSQKRKQKILQIIETEGEVEIHKLSEELSVSEITIRRDLNSLATDGLIFRTHGGAMKTDPLITAVTFAKKTDINSKVKDKICKSAAALIQDGDVIFMDCGSTVFRLCQFIKQKKIQVITNSLPVVNELQNSAVSINMIGGEVDQRRQAIHGKIAEEHIARYHATKAFLGIDGISKNGLFANSEVEASNTLAMASQSKKTYILCDSSKIEKESYFRFADLSLIDVIITDHSSKELELIRLKGVSILTV